MRIYAAGSLRAVLTAAAAALRSQGGDEVRFEFGPSGVLRERLAKGERADLFASANMEHPQALADAGLAGHVHMFARNRLCALAPSRLGITSDTLLDRMLDPTIRLATSTPKADPAGDYAWQVFELAEKSRRGAFDILSKKALQLVGGPGAPVPPAGRTAYGLVMAQGKADVFLTYCTNAVLARAEEPSLEVIALPAPLAVGADYGLVVMKGAGAGGDSFSQFLLGAAGQRLFADAGFSPAR